MIVDISLNDIPKKIAKGGNCAGVNTGFGRLQKDIKWFLSSGKDCAEVVVPKGGKARNVAISYSATAKRSGFPVLVMQRGDRVFLVRRGVNA